VLAAKQHAINASAAKAEEYERAEQWNDADIAYQHLVSMSDDQRWQEALAHWPGAMARDWSF